MGFKNIILTGTLLTGFSVGTAFSQCDTTHITGNLTVSTSDFMSGVYIVDGNFKINSDVIVFVQPFSAGGCGKLEIHANNIVVDGEINGDYAGHEGGTAGATGNTVNSLTGDANALTSCSNKDNEGIITVQGGSSGTGGNGTGSGSIGTDGNNGSGPKQTCGSNGDKYGMIPGAGGAGGGGGASYGGNGSNGQVGGNGSATHTSSNSSISAAYGITAGMGGTGGNAGIAYGTENDEDIDLGSGGAGSGGGGRSFYIGSSGNRGGNGGGAIVLIASNDLSISGHIHVAGENGQVGGNGGDGGESSRCCSDACDDCGEATLSSGAGGGSGSGAGSGGGILIKSETASISGTLSAIGGNGGSGGSGGNGGSCNYGGNIICDSETITTGNGQPGGKGGDGGGGRIKIFTHLCSSNQVNPTVNIAGGTNASAGTYSHICEGYLGLNESESFKFSVYPNPVKDFVTIQLLNSFDEDAQIHILDAKGTSVFTQIMVSDTEKIDLSGLTKGLYFATIQTKGKITTIKLIKQ